MRIRDLFQAHVRARLPADARVEFLDQTMGAATRDAGRRPVPAGDAGRRWREEWGDAAHGRHRRLAADPRRAEAGHRRRCAAGRLRRAVATASTRRTRNSTCPASTAASAPGCASSTIWRGVPTMKLLIDTDPGIDDAIAILFALAHPGLDGRGHHHRRRQYRPDGDHPQRAAACWRWPDARRAGDRGRRRAAGRGPASTSRDARRRRPRRRAAARAGARRRSRSDAAAWLADLLLAHPPGSFDLLRARPADQPRALVLDAPRGRPPARPGDRHGRRGERARQCRPACRVQPRPRPRGRRRSCSPPAST